MDLPCAVPFLDEAERLRAANAVVGLRRYWTRRHPELPSYTLGAAAYLDIPEAGHRQYLTTATRCRRALTRELGWLYERLEAAVASLFGRPAHVSATHALPGFHVFEHHERLGELEPKLHFDLQHERLDWTDSPNADPERRFSFTVPLVIPAAGAGLDLWPITHAETSERSEDALRELFATTPPTHHAYTPGELFVHDGHHLHRIAADRPMIDGEQLMTFQGHAVLDQGAWQLYW